MKIRPVSVELLRAGPPHGQLLSPLTPYLGVFGESAAKVVHFPYEHYQLERRLKQLRYDGGTEDDVAWRLELLRDTGVEIARVLGSLDGLPGALGSEGRSDTLTHLRLVLSASELALLPWELARVPEETGLPAESWLLLQSHSPVCLTRHVRSVPTDRVEWPRKPRLLVVTGDPDELPFHEHLDALNRAIAPWLKPELFEFGGRLWPKGSVTFLDNAAVANVEQTCRAAREDREPYTHVHVLAHGAEDESSERPSYGLLLRDIEGDPEVVSGERFASALTGGGRCPAVVTLATCDSANLGGVQAPGASFAHALHEAGVALVVASQFPLSMEGSGVLVERLYHGLFWGDNPLPLLHRIRGELHSVYTNRSHDWASLVVYEALPADLDAQLQETAYVQTRQALETALREFEEATADGRAVTEEAARELAERVERARCKLPPEGPYSMECLGLQGASRKRLAEIEWRWSRSPGLAEAEVEERLGRCRSVLWDAMQDYRQAATGFLRSVGETVHRKATLHWVLVQAVALGTLLGEDFDGLGEEYWAAARLSAEIYLDHESREERAWAHGSLAELWLLRLATAAPEDRREIAGRAVEHARRLLRLFPRRGSFEVFSTRRQFKRYLEWWGTEALGGHLERTGIDRGGWRGEDGVVETARRIVDVLGRNRESIAPLSPPPTSRTGPARSGRPAGTAAAGAAGPEAPSGRSRARKGAAGAGAAADEAPGAAGPAGGEPAAKPGRLGKRSRKRGGGEPFFELRMLPADYGDCLWLEYGDRADPSRVLVDCGPTSTFPRLKAKVESLPEKDRRFELFVLTHIDADHIGGTIPFFADETLGVSFGDVWFNGWKHLPMNKLGAKQGEIFSTLVRDRKLPWNAAAGGGPMMVGKDELPVYTLPGGLRLTLLSPTRDRLAKLRARWDKELEKHGLTPGSKVEYRKFLGGTRTTSTDVEALAESRFKADVTPPNGSSIAFLAEFEGRAALLAADAHVPVMVDSIKTLLARRGEERLRCDLFKLSHHASQGNTSAELIRLVDCPRFLVSTSGARFHHPDRETIARVIRYGGERPSVCFNYKSDDNEVWEREDLRERYGYRALFPEDRESGFTVSL